MSAKISINPNNNFHTATETTVFDAKADERFREYRRKWRENPERFIVEGFPLHIDIESVAVCNLRCPFCATTNSRWGNDKRGFMALSIYRKIIDEGAANGLCAIKLSLRGEPLLHPKLASMVEYAKKKGIMDVYFNTNAILLTEEKFEQLIDAGLDRISISIEGFTREVYEKFRVGATFERLLDNVSRLIEIRERKNSRFPQIRIQTVLLEELKRDFNDYVAFWRQYADEISYLDAREEETDTIKINDTAAWACSFLWQRVTILWDGMILPCLMHGITDFGSMMLGNIKDCFIRDLWQGEKERLLREAHRYGESHRIPACVECSYRAMEIGKP
ncbi:MAG: radical SAM protein [Candidatus Levybacteria bacterium]|nr:radical SAM protein [Candidatus Levybacteria bacterium]